MNKEELEQELEAYIAKREKRNIKDNVFKLKKELVEITRKHVKSLNTLNNKLVKTSNRLKTQADKIEKYQKEMLDLLLEQKNNFSSIEDTFFTLYHNIKKNQFIYANNPENWWNDYRDLKKHYQNLLKNQK